MSATGAGRNILNWTKRQQLGIDPPPEEDGKPSKTEEAAPAADAPTAASTSVRTKARQGTQAVQKGQEPRPPLRGDTFAPGTGEALVTQAPLYTPDEGITPDLKQYAKQKLGGWQALYSSDPLGATSDLLRERFNVAGRPLGAQYYGIQGGKERMSEVMPGAHARRVAKHTVYGPDGELVGHSLPPDELDPLIGSGAAGADKPIGGYTIGDQKPPPGVNTPQDVAARLMMPTRRIPYKGRSGFSFVNISPIEFNLDGSIDRSIGTINELSEEFEHLSIPLLQQYQRYLTRNLNEIDRADRELADRAAALKGRADWEVSKSTGLSRQQHKALAQRRSASLREYEALIKEQQKQAQRLSTIMKAMARRAGVSDEELK